MWMSPSSKRMKNMHEYENMLDVKVLYAEDIDRETTNPLADKRRYRVIGWVHPGQIDFCTGVAEGLPDPEWNLRYHIPLHKSMACPYLHLEVIRTRCNSDPGTSTRIALVGRTRIPLPKKLDTEKSGRFGLVRLNNGGCIPDGHIAVIMRLRRVEGMM